MKTIRLLYTFYKTFLYASLLITAVCIYYIYILGMEFFAPFFWGKIITQGVIFYFISAYKKKEFYYYQNLGVSKKMLWISTLLFDTILFIVLLIFAFKIL